MFFDVDGIVLIRGASRFIHFQSRVVADGSRFVSPASLLISQEFPLNLHEREIRHLPGILFVTVSAQVMPVRGYYRFSEYELWFERRGLLRVQGLVPTVFAGCWQDSVPCRPLFASRFITISAGFPHVSLLRGKFPLVGHSTGRAGVAVYYSFLPVFLPVGCPCRV